MTNEVVRMALEALMKSVEQTYGVEITTKLKEDKDGNLLQRRS